MALLDPRHPGPYITCQTGCLPDWLLVRFGEFLLLLLLMLLGAVALAVAVAFAFAVVTL